MEIIPGLASVVIATYNRSNVLRLAIESVLWQTYTNWEVVVVGDCCTDDTAEVVASFKDPRIRFYNLPENFGEQSGPNNFGCQNTRGEFIAFLNHDDLFFPQHLENAVRLLRDERSNLASGGKPDLVFSRRYSIDGANERVSAKPPLGTLEYDPQLFLPASCWVFRRELMDDIGPWRAAAELYNIPSQDWIFRVFKAGKNIRCTTQVSVVFISSLIVDDTYKDRRDVEQRTYYDLLRSNPDFAPPEEAIAPAEAGHQRRLRRLGEILTKRRTWRSLQKTITVVTRDILVNCVVRTLDRVAHPFGVAQFIVGRGQKGKLVQDLRHRRGLPYKSLTKGGIPNDPN